MSKRQKVVLVILLVLFLMPPVERYPSDYEIWQFGNLHYRETDICFDGMPVPERSYHYQAFFFRLSHSSNYCKEWQWKKSDITLHSPIVINKSYRSVFYLSFATYYDQAFSAHFVIWDWDIVDWKSK